MNGYQLMIKGMEQAEETANKVHSNWSTIAYEFVTTYCQMHKGEIVQAEDIRQAGEDMIPEPPSKRAWGSIIRKAATDHKLQRIGYGPVDNPKAHRAFSTIWKIL